MQLSEEEWRKKLTAEQYRVLREKGTEAPGTGALLYNNDAGMYVCGACGVPLFSSQAKYTSTVPGLEGWPSFDKPVAVGAVLLQPDNSAGLQRTEVICAHCGSHLGHLFADALAPSGQHYCVNSAALKFQKSQ